MKPIFFFLYFILIPVTSFADVNDSIVSFSQNVEESIETLKEDLRTTKNKKEKAKIHYAIATFERFNNLDVAIHHLERSKKLNNGLDEKLDFQYYQLMIGLYTQKDNANKSLELAFEAINKFKDSEPEYLADIYAATSKCYSYKKDFSKSSEFYEKAIALAKGNELNRLSLYQINYGSSLVHAGYNREGLEMLNSSRINLYRMHPEEILTMSTLLEISTGEAYLTLNELDSAFVHFQKAEEYVSKLNHTEMRISLWEKWIKYYSKIKAFDQAENYLDSMMTKAVGLNHTNMILRAHKRKMNLQFDQGDYKDAYLTHVVYQKKKDSSESVSRRKMESALKENFKLREAKYQLKQKNLKTELGLKEKEASNNRLSLILILVSSLFLVAILIFQIRNRNNRLKKQEFELEKTKLQFELETRNNTITNNILKIGKLTSILTTVEKELKNNFPDMKTKEADKLDQIIKTIKVDLDADIWKEFEIRFNQAHNGFYNRIAKDFPKLTFNERRLCAFIKLNMNAKEISSITGQSPHSINIARGRLRKKFEITNQDISLTTFIANY